jgi:hypothetical protein
MIVNYPGGVQSLPTAIFHPQPLPREVRDGFVGTGPAAFLAPSARGDA